jgi:hypothetical protein
MGYTESIIHYAKMYLEKEDEWVVCIFYTE